MLELLRLVLELRVLETRRWVLRALLELRMGLLQARVLRGHDSAMLLRRRQLQRRRDSTTTIAYETRCITSLSLEAP